MPELLIETTDTNLLHDLQKAKIAGLTFARRSFRMDSADVAVAIQPIIIVVLSALDTPAGNVALNVLSSWLYDRLSRNKSSQTIINTVNVTNNINQINVVINNYIQETQPKQTNGAK